MRCGRGIFGKPLEDGWTGSTWGGWALYTGSPLIAIESKLGTCSAGQPRSGMAVTPGRVWAGV